MRAHGMWFALVVAAIAGAACHTRPPATAPSRTAPVSAAPARPSAPPPAPARAVAAPSRALTDEELFARKSLNELNAEHPLGDAFFDYNQTTLGDEDRRVLQRDAQWLAKWPQTKVVVEGHCDERGTAEYNLALGDRRAEVVTEYLTSLGVSPSRVETRSLGKEAPFCRDSGEACWAQNRRGHFVITAK